MGYDLTNDDDIKKAKKQDREKIVAAYETLVKEKPELFDASKVDLNKLEEVKEHEDEGDITGVDHSPREESSKPSKKMKTGDKKAKTKQKKKSTKIKWKFPDNPVQEVHQDRLDSDSKKGQKIILEKARQSLRYAKAYSMMLIEAADEYGLWEDDLFLQPKIEKIIKDHEKVHQDNEKKRLNILSKKIIELLKKRGEKMPASDIDAFLKHQDVDDVKAVCENMYHNGDISRTSNYRYFILTEEKKKPKPKKASAPKSEEVDVEKELEKYKGLLDKGLITQEEYDAKRKQILGL